MCRAIDWITPIARSGFSFRQALMSAAGTMANFDGSRVITEAARGVSPRAASSPK